MNNKQVILIFSAVVLIIILLMSTIFTIKKVPDVKWQSDYKFNSKEPYGGWMFDKMVKNYFGEENVFYHYIDTTITEIDSNNVLYIRISNSASIGKNESENLKDFISKGNQVLLIGGSANLKTDYNDYADIYSTSVDSVFKFKFEKDTSQREFVYKHYRGSFDVAQLTSVKYLAYAEDRALGITNDSMMVFFKTEFHYGGVFYKHLMPEMFSNLASKQDFYLDHFNQVFSSFSSSSVVLDHDDFKKFAPKTVVLDHDSFNTDREFIDADSESPIQYVLANPPLKWAYYLLLLSALTYIIFRGKRRQKVIPTIEKNTNTSLEYVATLSSLFRNQGQNNKLVPHMQRVFYQKIKTRYYLDAKHPEFISLLSRKSKIEEKEINVILNMFDNSDQDLNFTDDQLINLHTRLETFYKNWK